MINLELPDQYTKLEAGMKKMAIDLFRPISRKYDEKEHAYPVELDIFRNNFMRRKKVSKKDSDTNLNGKKNKNSGRNLSTIITTEELAWGDVALFMSIPNAAPGNAALIALATDEQLVKYGKKWIAFSVTEPEVGSDSGSVRTTAVLDGEQWVLNGEKIFVTAADRCDLVIVWASVDKEAGKAGIKPFLVEKNTPGFTLVKLEKKMGLRANDTGNFILSDCRIPKDNILGSTEVKNEKTSKGFKGIMKTFDNTRPIVGAMAVGVAKAALEFTKEKMEESGIKIDYNKNPNNLSAIEKEYYLMEAHNNATRLLTLKAAWMADNNIPNSLSASMSKAKGGKCATIITQKCCDMLGYMGYSRKFLPEKWLRDGKILDIFEGTGQIQHLIIARHILKLSSKELK